MNIRSGAARVACAAIVSVAGALTPSGARVFAQDGIILEVNQTVTVTVRLRLAQAGQIDVVNADAPFLDTEGKLNALYLAALSRSLRPEEKSRLVRYVESGGPSRDPDKALADVFWAILNSSEFILNH